MTPKHKAIFAKLPVGVRAAAQAYYDALDNYEREYSEFARARTNLSNASNRLYKARGPLDRPGKIIGAGAVRYITGSLYIGLRTGRYYEGTGHDWRANPLKNDGHDGKRKAIWVREPLVELDPDDPFREKRRVATICNKLEGKP